MIPYDVKIGQRYLCDFRHGSTEIYSDPALSREIKDMPLYHFPYCGKRSNILHWNTAPPKFYLHRLRLNPKSYGVRGSQRQRSSQMWGNTGRPRANFPPKILKEKWETSAVSQNKQCKWKSSLKSVKGKKCKEKQRSRLFELKAYSNTGMLFM